MLHALLFLAGLALLVAGAECLIRGSSRLALRMGVPPLVVGLTVVAFGTSTPEMIVSTRAAMAGQADLALGNALGSNIFNVLFILGLSALVAPLVVARSIIWREVPVMLAAALLAWGLAADGLVSRWEGFLLIILLLSYTAYQVRIARRNNAPCATAAS